MLALWSRATRTPGTCRCISCVSNNSAIAKRAGGASIRGSWLGTLTSTFVYTAVFAAGLAIDAKAKRQRNQQWDTAFEELRQEMGESSASERECGPRDRIPSGGLETIEDLLAKGVRWDTIRNAVGMELWEDGLQQARPSDAHVELIPDSFWDLLPFDSRFPGSQLPTPDWPANTGPQLIRHHLPPQSLWSLDHMRWTAVRKRQSWKKLAIQELSIGVLIHALLDHAEVSQLPQAALKPLSSHIQSIALLSPYENEGARYQINEDIKKLQSLPVDVSIEAIMEAKVSTKGPGIPSYHQDADGDFYAITKQMNTAIENLFNDARTDSLTPENDDQFRLTTAKICHNLLVSTAAPDLHTFNLLLSGYKRRGRFHLVNDVIEAFDVCKIRPNELTCASILDHYVMINAPEYFSCFVAKMRGAQNALMLARADININDMGKDRLIRVSDSKVYQKVYPTPVVFSALMKGVLKFAGFERAIDIYFEMKEDGWGLDALALSHFLQDCVKRGDWNGGLMIWQEISSIKQNINPIHMSKAYANMLGLCSVTGNTVAFNQLLTEIARKGYDRRRIMSSAVTIAHEAQERKGNMAPAWAADNLLIAVSDYMDSSQSIDDHDPASSTLDFDFETAFEDNAASFWSQATVPSEPADLLGSEKVVMGDPDQAWETWIQHELGDPMPTNPASGTGEASSKPEHDDQSNSVGKRKRKPKI
ncbi:hypothetical protein CC80DRAFT_206913 [Byssothecium circinans]|uniref:Pentatricopeptide repeat protein n=1 Tax=Byssothecium circinans TaxID=147558 RepID=A0A6A5TF46_9PLEO|nr:hypothetical protein CC80DRAFT_206913 [Byssothecium circinans]